MRAPSVTNERRVAIANLRAERVAWSREIDPKAVAAHEQRFVERHR